MKMEHKVKIIIVLMNTGGVTVEKSMYTGDNMVNVQYDLRQLKKHDLIEGRILHIVKTCLDDYFVGVC